MQRYLGQKIITIHPTTLKIKISDCKVSMTKGIQCTKPRIYSMIKKKKEYIACDTENKIKILEDNKLYDTEIKIYIFHVVYYLYCIVRHGMDIAQQYSLGLYSFANHIIPD